MRLAGNHAAAARWRSSCRRCRRRRRPVVPRSVPRSAPPSARRRHPQLDGACSDEPRTPATSTPCRTDHAASLERDIERRLQRVITDDVAQRRNAVLVRRKAHLSETAGLRNVDARRSASTPRARPPAHPRRQLAQDQARAVRHRERAIDRGASRRPRVRRGRSLRCRRPPARAPASSRPGPPHDDDIMPHGATYDAAEFLPAAGADDVAIGAVTQCAHGRRSALCAPQKRERMSVGAHPVQVRVAAH
mgnify:CR=1 FL=1